MTGGGEPGEATPTEEQLLLLQRVVFRVGAGGMMRVIRSDFLTGWQKCRFPDL